jgi:hypothetical protein
MRGGHASSLADVLSEVGEQIVSHGARVVSGEIRPAPVETGGRLPCDACDRHAGDVAQDVGNVAGLALAEIIGGQDRDRARIARGQIEAAGAAGHEDFIVTRRRGADLRTAGRLVLDILAVLRRHRHSPNQRRHSDAAQKCKILHGFLPSSATWWQRQGDPSSPQPSDVAHNESLFPRLANP